MVEQITPVQAALGESPQWHPLDKCLYWIDALQPCVYRLDSVTKAVKRYPLPAAIGCIAPRAPHGLVVWMGNAAWQWAPEAGMIRPLTEPLILIQACAVMMVSATVLAGFMSAQFAAIGIIQMVVYIE
jgi:sugar lactone lactonase YvrE